MASHASSLKKEVKHLIYLLGFESKYSQHLDILLSPIH
jgi:hypothetical protein